MSISKEVTVWCDEPGCVQWAPGLHRLAREGRKNAARLAGFTHRDGKDYCREHSVSTREGT